MMKMKKWNQLFISLLLLLNSGYLLHLILSNNQSKILVTLSFYFVVWIPKIICRLWKIKFPAYMELIYLIFLFFAQFLGSIVGLYSIIEWYDSFVHFVSGILASVLALVILFWCQKYDCKSLVFHFFFMITVTLAIASFWEFFEFISDQILNGDTQNVKETGVADTMKDMIVAFLGSVLTSIYYIYEKCCDKKSIFSHFEKEFGCKHK